WLASLRLPLEASQYKRVLLLIHRRIIPFMSRPTMLMDFLTDSYHSGGPISLLALNGLFTLMQDHNLEYPDFYSKLYALFDRHLLHVRYRARFFRLVDLFLSSSHLPAYLVAAFIKRLSRLSLTGPPAGIILTLPLVYNLLKRHPSCMVLIHRATPDAQDDPSPSAKIVTDPFDMDQVEPSKCKAIDSSLWELHSLRHHYHPNIASLSKVLTEAFTKPSYDLEDFLDHTYATLTDSELAR
ncbi:nucleolar complex protein, partial [Piptocephalis cylindrospora]